MVDDVGGVEPLDLTPEASRPDRSARRPWSVLALVLVVVAVVFVLLRTLGDASLFFYEVDEAVDRRVELGRFLSEGERETFARTLINALGKNR